MLSTRLLPDSEALPADMPAPEHVTDVAGWTSVSKFTPATVIVLGVEVVPMVNDTVAVIPAVAATLLDRMMEVEVRKAEKMAG
jgi:hypothetical protein